MKDKASSVIVELPHTNCTRGDQILHEIIIPSLIQGMGKIKKCALAV